MIHRITGSRIARFSFTLGVLIALGYIVDWEVFAQVFVKIDWALFLPLLLIQGVARLIEAFQLWTVIKSIGRFVPVTRVFLANALAVFYGFVLPGLLLSTAPKWLVLSKEAGSRSDILNAIIYNRLALLVPPVFIGCLALGMMDIFDEGHLKYAFFFTGFGVVFSTAFLFHKRTGFLVLRIMRWITRRCPEKLKNSGDTFITSFAKLQDLETNKHLVIYSLATATALTRISAWIYAAALVSIVVPPEILALTYSVVVVLAVFPLTLGNIGVREGVLVLVLGIYGISPAEALLMGMILFLEQIFLAVVGGLYQIRLASEQSPIRNTASKSS